MKKAYKALSVLMIVLMLATVCSSVFAVNIESLTTSAELDSDLNNKMTTAGSKILTIVTNVGIILSVVMMAILGIRYMAGSAADKSEYKKSMMPYLVGAICLFGAAAIAKIVMGFGKSLL